MPVWWWCPHCCDSTSTCFDGHWACAYCPGLYWIYWRNTVSNDVYLNALTKARAILQYLTRQNKVKVKKTRKCKKPKKADIDTESESD